MSDIICDTCTHADRDSIPQGIHSKSFAIGCSLGYDIEQVAEDDKCQDHSEIIDEIF